MKCAAQVGNDAHSNDRRWNDGETRRWGRFIYHSGVIPRASSRQRDGATKGGMEGGRDVKEGVQGREDGGAVGSHGDGKVSELPCLLRGRSRKTTEQQWRRRSSWLCSFYFGHQRTARPRQMAGSVGARSQGHGETKTHTHTGGLRQYYINQPRPKRLLTAAVWRLDSAP